MRLARVELALDAVLREVVAQKLRRLRLVPGRVDGVEPKERLQERGHLVPERHPAGSILRAWPTSSPKRRASARPRTPRSRCACGLRRSTTSSVSSTCSAPGSALRRAIEDDRPPSMILFGPPGTGKTTIARIVAERTGAAFEEISAVSARVDDVRAVIARARDRLGGNDAQDDPLHRRDPPLQQGAAGLGPARRRGRARHAHRGDHREPVLRGELGAALTLHGDRADRALGGRARRDPRARGGSARRGGVAGGASSSSRRAQAATRVRRSRSSSSPWRPPTRRAAR